MAYLVACLSARARARLGTTLVALTLSLACLSSLHLVAVLFSFVRHSFLLHDLIISLFDDVYINLVSVGVLELAIALVCWKHTRNVRQQPTNPAIARVQFVSSALLAFCCVAAALCVPALSHVLAVVEAELAPRYQHGISRYMDSPAWGTAVDRIQAYLQCCGASAHTDWYTYSWLPFALLPADPVLYSKLVQPDGQVLVPLVPSSCCRPGSSNSSCGHRSWLEGHSQPSSWAEIQPADPGLLYTGGCVAAISDLYARDVLFFKLVLLLMSILQVVVLVGSRYLVSSTENSLLLGRPAGKAPGWLLEHLPGKPPIMTLEQHDEGCGDDVIEIIDGSKKEKTRWKCFKKLKGKSDKETNSEGTSSTKTVRKAFRSPCLAKLKEKCKRRQKSGQTSEEERKPDDQEFEEEIDLRYLQIVPDQKTGHFRLGVEDSPKGGRVVQRKLSRNLMDVENEDTSIGNRPGEITHLYEAGVKHNSPFIAREIMNKIKSVGAENDVIPNERRNQGTRHSMDQETERDFQQTRKVFERSIKGETPSRNELRVKSKKRADYRYPVNLIDLEDPPIHRQSEVKSKISPVNSPKSEEDSAPIILRNYKIPSDT